MGYLEQKSFSGPGDSALIGPALHQHDIRADFFDAAPGDYVIVPAACHPEKSAGTGDDDGTEIAFGEIDLYIGDKAQPLAGADTDHFLALEVGKFDGHEAFLLLVSVYA